MTTNVAGDILQILLGQQLVIAEQQGRLERLEIDLEAVVIITKTTQGQAYEDARRKLATAPARATQISGSTKKNAEDIDKLLRVVKPQN